MLSPMVSAWIVERYKDRRFLERLKPHRDLQGAFYYRVTDPNGLQVGWPCLYIPGESEVMEHL